MAIKRKKSPKRTALKARRPRKSARQKTAHTKLRHKTVAQLQERARRLQHAAEDFSETLLRGKPTRAQLKKSERAHEAAWQARQEFLEAKYGKRRN